MHEVDQRVLEEVARLITQRAEQFSQDLAGVRPSGPVVGNEEAWENVRSALLGNISDKDCKAVILDMLYLYTKSLCTMIDGGTKLSDENIRLRLQDQHGHDVAVNNVWELRDRLGSSEAG